MGRWKNPEKSRVDIFDAQFGAYGENPLRIVTKFCTWVDIPDIITCATFGDDRLRGRFPVSPLTCVVALQHSRTAERMCDISSTYLSVEPL